MTVFRLFYKILRRSSALILMHVAIFVVMLFFTIQAVSGTETESAVPMQRVSLSVFDHDNSLTSEALTDYLAARTDIVEAKSENRDDLMDELYSGNIDYVLIIPEGFEEKPTTDNKTLRLTTYVSYDASSAEYTDTLIQNFLANWDFTRSLYGENLSDEDLDRALKANREVMDVRAESRLLGGEKADSLGLLRFGLVYLDYAMIAVPFLIFGIPIIVMEKPEKKRRDVASGYSNASRIAQIFFAAYLSHAVIWLLMVVVSFALTSFSLITEPAVPYMLASSFVHMLATGSMGLFFAHLFPKEGAMGFLSTVLSLLISFSSGIFIPAAFLWEPFHKFSMIFPSYWDVTTQNSIQGIVVGGRSMATFNQGILVMGLMALAGFLLTLLIRYRSSRKVENT